MASGRHKDLKPNNHRRATTRAARSPRPEPVALSRERIVQAALKLIDESGLGNFSIREVARLLGVYPTALYWHIAGGRNALLAEVASTTLGDVAPPFAAGDDWAHWIRTLFHRYRDSLRCHPNVAPLLGAQLVSNAGVDPALVERALSALDAAGFHGEKLVDAYNAVIAAMLGYVTLELAPVPIDDPYGWAQSFERKIRALSPSEYPHLVANLSRLANRAFIVRWQSGIEAPLAGGFNLYVEALIGGLQCQIASVKPPEVGQTDNNKELEMSGSPAKRKRSKRFSTVAASTKTAKSLNRDHRHRRTSSNNVARDENETTC
jgi:TetR/AcrR family transcriptional regulator, tetracycline repressor protein